MADAVAAPGRRAVRVAQLLLVIVAGALWAAARLPWVIIRSFDGLGQPRQAEVTGATWSTALLPLAVLALAAAVAAVAVRGWPLRLLAALLAVASLAAGYLAIGMWVVADVAARGAALADVSLIWLVGADRRYVGAGLTLAAALGMLGATALLMRAAGAGDSAHTAKYRAPGTRRSAAKRVEAGLGEAALSERMIWDALDEGHDPTGDPGVDPAGGPSVDATGDPGGNPTDPPPGSAR